YGWRYSRLPLATLPITLRIPSAYGRVAATRSCALRILLTATFSIALVILRVLLILPILLFISLPPAMTVSPFHSTNGVASHPHCLPGLSCLEFFNGSFERRLDLVVVVTGFIDISHQLSVFSFHKSD